MADNDQSLLAAVIELAQQTRPDKVQQLAARIRGVDKASVNTHSLGWATSSSSRRQLDPLLSAWRGSGASSEELYGMLVGASAMCQAAESRQALELVWTGPSSQLVSTRKTEQVLLEVVRSAQRELFMTSFVAYDVESMTEALGRAIRLGVEVSLLLESSEDHGGTLSVDVISSMRNSLPQAKIYYWKEKGESFVGGRVHAKVAVADGQVCFISSANLTGHAMEKNMEAGILVRGGDIPARLHQHLIALATIGVISAV